MEWMDAMNACIPTTKELSKVLRTIYGSYGFCFRDYVNNEELMFLQCQRWSIELLLLRPTRQTGQLIVQNDGASILRETGIVFGVLPICIEWKGRLVHGRVDNNMPDSDVVKIDWETTLVRLGWHGLWAKTIHRPEAAEKLRKDPWVLHLPPDNTARGDVVVFHREGVGKLAYARDDDD